MRSSEDVTVEELGVAAEASATGSTAGTATADEADPVATAGTGSAGVSAGAGSAVVAAGWDSLVEGAAAPETAREGGGAVTPAFAGSVLSMVDTKKVISP